MKKLSLKFNDHIGNAKCLQFFPTKKDQSSVQDYYDFFFRGFLLR